MNSRKITVALLAIVALVAFAIGVRLYQGKVQQDQTQQASDHAQSLVRPHSPVLGPREAPVTIVEFFDPACETCRAFYPIVKDLMKQYLQDVRLVIRYAPFHQGSDEVVKLLEASRKQGKYEPVLEWILAAQPLWADHGNPQVELAFQAAEKAGLNLQQARADMQSPDAAAAMEQDIIDLTTLKVSKTPTFYVNGRPLPSFGPQQLTDLVAEEVTKARAARP